MVIPIAVHRPRLFAWLIPVLWTLALGLWGLSRQGSVWRDEAATWQVAQRSTPELWRLLAEVDIVHGAYYLLMHELFECFGPGVTTLRLPSVLAIAVAAACTAVIGQRLVGFCAGLGGGLALGLLPAVQFYLQEGRPYALVAAGAGISTLLLVSILEGRGQRIHWVAYGGVLMACGLLNWISLLIPVAHAVTLVWAGSKRKIWMPWAVVSSGAVAAVLPLILLSKGQSRQISWIPPLTWHMLIGPAILIAIGIIGALLSRPVFGRLSIAAVGLPLLIVPQIGLMGLSLVQPIFLDRYILFSLLGLALLIGAGLSAVVRAAKLRVPRVSMWILPMVVVMSFGVLLPESLAKRSPGSRVDDVLAVAADVRRLKKGGDALLFIPSARRDTKMVTPDAFSGMRDIALKESPEVSGTLKGVEASSAEIRGAMLAHRRIVLIADGVNIAKPVSTKRDLEKLAILKRHFTMVSDKSVRGRRVSVYNRTGSVNDGKLVFLDRETDSATQ